MAKLAVEIEAEGERSALTELQHLISQAIDKSAVPVNFRGTIDNRADPSATAQGVRLLDLIDARSTRNQRKAVTVLETYAGVIWLSQLMEMNEEDVVGIRYFGEILLPALEALLHEHSYSWPAQ